MKGIQFIVDEQGQRKAVQIDLEIWQGLWEKIADLLKNQSNLQDEIPQPISQNSTIMDELMKNPINVKGVRKITRDEIHNRKLSI